jgi:hypothetical protein
MSEGWRITKQKLKIDLLQDQPQNKDLLQFYNTHSEHDIAVLM